MLIQLASSVERKIVLISMYICTIGRVGKGRVYTFSGVQKDIQNGFNSNISNSSDSNRNHALLEVVHNPI